MKPLERTFICWPIHSIDTESMDQDKLAFMYLKVTDGTMAQFYQDFDLKIRIPMKISLKTIKNQSLYSSPADGVLCFESDITDEMQSLLKQFNIEINEDESKIQFTFHPDGTIGHVLYSLRYFYSI